MAEFSPTIIPLGSLAQAAAASAEIARQEQLSAYAIDIDVGTTMGYIPQQPDWP